MTSESEYVLVDVLGLGAAEKSPTGSSPPSGNSTSSSENEKNRERGFHLESPKREEHDKESDIVDDDKAFITETKELLHYIIPFLGVKQQDCPPILENILDVCKSAHPPPQRISFGQQLLLFHYSNPTFGICVPSYRG
ncbi:hypothetical protein HN51_033598 [Arachis hypogaea]